jgi:RHS repeat-associated protein
MAGISSKSAGKLENKKKFNDGTELNTDFDINIYETSYRLHDPQLGRFHQIDPLAGIADEYSPYSYVLNNPLLFNDPYGLDTTRGNNPKPKPEPGDVWIPGKGPNQIYDIDRGWSAEVPLDEIVVTGKSSNAGNESNTAPSWWASAYFYTSNGIGAAGSYFGLTGNTTHNEWWWRQKNGAWRLRTSSTKNNYVINRSYKLRGNALSKAKALSTKLAIVNVGLIGSDIVVNRQIKASHVINGFMTGISFTGVGSVVSGLWFIADFGTQGICGKSLSDRLDEAVGEPLLDFNE